VRDGFRKLKPRPGQAGRGVAEHQRARIHAAVIELAQKEGYRALTVTGIARTAGVANRTFYENFQSKEDCFLETYDLVTRAAARGVLAAQRHETHLRGKVRATVLAFVRAVARNPQAARMALIEAAEDGPAVERVRHSTGLFEALLAEGCKSASDSIQLPPVVLRGTIAGIVHLARVRLLAGVEDELVAEEPQLAEWALSLCSPAAGRTCPSVDAISPKRRFAFRTEPPPRATEELLLVSEREMILRTVGKLAAREGYAALTVPRIRNSVGISRRRFEQNFEGVDDCFLSAVEACMDRVLEGSTETLHEAAEWPTRLYRGLMALCRRLGEDRAISRLLFVELPKAGRQATRWRAGVIAKLSAELHAAAPSDSQPPLPALEASTAGVWSLLEFYALNGRTRQIPQLIGPAAYLMLAPAIGAEAAADVVQEERGLKTALARA